MSVHRTPQSLGIAMQTHQGVGFVSVRSYGDTFTIAGLLAMAKTLATYFTGVSGGTLLGGYPASPGAGGASPLPDVIILQPAYCRVACKVGDETTLLGNIVTTMLVGGNTTTTGAQKGIPGPVNAWGD